MDDLPWWGWVIVGLVIVFLFLKTAVGSFRREVRQQFLELLKTEYPDLEVVELRPRSVRFRSDTLGDGEIPFRRLYNAIAELGSADLKERESVYRSFLDDHKSASR